MEILERSVVEKIISKLDHESIVKTAWEGYIPNMKNGYATLNLETGLLESVSLGTGETNHPSEDVRIYLYRIDQNLDVPYEDILDEEEMEKWEKFEEEGSFDQFCNDQGIIQNERIIEALLHYFYDDWTEAQYSIKEQLDKWYKKRQYCF